MFSELITTTDRPENILFQVKLIQDQFNQQSKTAIAAVKALISCANRKSCNNACFVKIISMVAEVANSPEGSPQKSSIQDLLLTNELLSTIEGTLPQLTVKQIIDLIMAFSLLSSSQQDLYQENLVRRLFNAIPNDSALNNACLDELTKAAGFFNCSEKVEPLQLKYLQQLFGKISHPCRNIAKSIFYILQKNGVTGIQRKVDVHGIMVNVLANINNQLTVIEIIDSSEKLRAINWLKRELFTWDSSIQNIVMISENAWKNAANKISLLSEQLGYPLLNTPIEIPASPMLSAASSCSLPDSIASEPSFEHKSKSMPQRSSRRKRTNRNKLPEIFTPEITLEPLKQPEPEAKSDAITSSSGKVDQLFSDDEAEKMAHESTWDWIKNQVTPTWSLYDLLKLNSLFVLTNDIFGYQRTVARKVPEHLKMGNCKAH